MSLRVLGGGVGQPFGAPCLLMGGALVSPGMQRKKCVCEGGRWLCQERQWVKGIDPTYSAWVSLDS